MNLEVYVKFQQATKDKNIHLMKQIYEKNKTDIDIINEYYEMLFEVNDFVELRYLINESIKLRGDHPDVLLKQARLEIETGDYDTARKVLNRLMDGKKNKKAIFLMGRIEYESGNFSKAKENYRKINTKPYKPYILFELAKTEYRLNNIKKSKEYFELLINTNKKVFALNYLVLINIKENNFHEAFYYLNLLLSINKNVVMNIVLYICQELNIYMTNKNLAIPLNYSDLQLIDYDEYVAISHILERHKRNFSEDIDIYKLFNEIQDKLNDSTKSNELAFNDVYLVPYENAGTNNENCIRVITLPNTKNIITMYPIFINRFENIEIPIQEDKKLTRTNSSQIDKFNKRYGIK